VELIIALLVGLIAGYVGKALLPGRDPGGLLVTILIGLVGSLLGHFIFSDLLGLGDEDRFDLGGLPGAIVGTVLLLYGYRKLIAERSGGEQAPPRVR
jgi:uncharacterized membrane protein YeaQ/YmgE (transglycosylase-associated protein family)